MAAPGFCLASPVYSLYTQGPCICPVKGTTRVCTRAGGLFAALGPSGKFGICIMLAPGLSQAETWATHARPEPRPLQKKSLLSSQDLNFFFPTQIKPQPEKGLYPGQR